MKQQPILGKRKRAERTEKQIDEYDSDHDQDWKRKNLEEIDKDDDEIKQLERKLGIRTDAKRKKRYFQRIEEEGLGLGIFDYLDNIDKLAKVDPSRYQKPDNEYKFNDPKFETALGDSDIEDGGMNKMVSNDRQEGFEDEFSEEMSQESIDQDDDSG